MKRMSGIEKLKRGIILELFAVAALLTSLSQRYDNESIMANSEGGFIKWVEFNVPSEALGKAYEWDRDTYGEEVHIEWIPLLAYVAAKHGGEFPEGSMKELDQAARQLMEKQTDMTSLTKDMKYYKYYLEAYTAVLGGMVGEYRVQEQDENGKSVWVDRYGLKAFSPIAKGFPYQDYDDFGSSRSYGYKRPHLGHDMMGQIGTPIIAIESGYVEAIGWNRYGGWRIGIRSFDQKRYYYYAHLRQNYPYAEGLEEGSVVTAGDVIGYMGHTGYSTEENVNNIKVTHLHWGMQLIFDESQKDSDNEIWIDCYQLSNFLNKNKSEAAKVPDTKEWKRVQLIEDPSVNSYNQLKK